MREKIIISLGIGFGFGFLLAVVMLQNAAKTEVQKHPTITLEKYYFGEK